MPDKKYQFATQTIQNIERIEEGFIVSGIRGCLISQKQ